MYKVCLDTSEAFSGNHTKSVKKQQQQNKTKTYCVGKGAEKLIHPLMLDYRFVK